MLLNIAVQEHRYKRQQTHYCLGLIRVFITTYEYTHLLPVPSIPGIIYLITLDAESVKRDGVLEDCSLVLEAGLLLTGVWAYYTAENVTKTPKIRWPGVQIRHK